MDRYQETFETWNNIASIYEQKFMNLNLYDASYDYICHSIAKTNANILDVGCGPGNISKYLLSKRPDFKILGIDVSPNMIEIARVQNPTATFEVMDCRKPETITDNYDGIIAGFYIPYLSDEEVRQFFSWAQSKLSEGGLIYLSFVEGHPDNSDFKSGSGGRVFFNYYESDHLLKYLKSFGFNEIKCFYVDYCTSDSTIETHSILISKKRSTAS